MKNKSMRFIEDVGSEKNKMLTQCGKSENSSARFMPEASGAQSHRKS